jgi:hypothetical protein
MEKIRKMDWTFLFLLAVFAVISAIYLLEPGSAESFGFLKNIANVVIVMVVVITCILVVKNLGTDGLQARAVLFLGIGFSCWALADIVWLLSRDVVVSLADIGYILGYVFIVMGIFNGIRLSDPTLFKNRKKMFFLSLIIIAAVGVYFYYFRLSWNPSVPVIENVLSVGYVLADMLITALLVFMVYSIFSGRLSSGWIIIGAGLVLLLIADFWYAKNYELYESGKQTIDLVWYLSYLFFVYGLVQFRRVHEQLRETLAAKSVVQKKET